jgi:hypothetical protein
VDNQDNHPKSENTQPNHASFKTPEQVASADPTATGSPLLKNTLSSESEARTMAKKKRKFKFKFWPPNKEGWIVIATILVLIAAGSYWFIKVDKTVKSNAPKISAKAVAKPDTVASNLTGLQVSPAINKLPITAVMIENSLDAQPESGLGEAGVVFEAIAEGGITRFVALFQANNQTSIGPVRSARPYFISWMLGFDADYAHVGGSPEAETDISLWGVKDMDQFYNSNYYQRISTREAPHNVYTTPAELTQLEQSKGGSYTTSSFTSWTRKPASPLKTPTTTSINLDLSNSDYNVSYAYDASTNTYNRDTGGSPQVDAYTNKQVSVPVVIAIVVPESNGPLDGLNAYYSEYQTVGSGTAYVFQDGGVSVGTWSKSSNNSQILFTTTSGKPLALNPGEVWVTAVSSASEVSYQ